jgi:PleD family two-component response regulator
MIEHKENSISSFVTVSIGVAFVNFNKNFNVMIDKSLLYKDADELLYKAKNNGRNTIVIGEKT